MDALSIMVAIAIVVWLVNGPIQLAPMARAVINWIILVLLVIWIVLSIFPIAIPMPRA